MRADRASVEAGAVHQSVCDVMLAAVQAAPRTVMILEDRGRFVCTGCRREWLCPLSFCSA